MKITNIASSTVIISSNGYNILCDPWLFDGEYYGSWYHYPPLEVRESVLNTVDYIYLSHIHPDHFSRKTFSFLDKKIPVLIHRYEAQFLKKNLEFMGFTVIELDNGSKFSFNDNFFVEIYAADNCNPELCGKFFGCGVFESTFGSTQIDSLALFCDSDYKVLNVNDCPYSLSKGTLDFILKKYGKIDFLLVGYAGAGPFPQCFNLNATELELAAINKQTSFIRQSVDFVDLVKPSYYMPFAGTYVLGGKLATANNYRGVPDIFDAKEAIDKMITSGSKGVLLNAYEHFDLCSAKFSKEFSRTIQLDREDYIKKYLTYKTFDYERDPIPTISEFIELIPDSFTRFKMKVNEIGYSSNTFVIVDMVESFFLVINLNKMEYRIERNIDFSNLNFLRLNLDPRLLLRILKGPRFAHWNNASIGSHIKFDRSSSNYDRGLHYCLNFLHK